MTAILKDTHQFIDIDWFLIDIDYTIIHIASGGGLLPISIAASKENCDLCTRFFRNEAMQYLAYDINPLLHKYRSFANTADEEKYLEDFCLFSKKGIYSYDKTVLNDPYDLHYHCVAIPQYPFVFAHLPPKIQDILKQTQLNCKITDLNQIKLDNFFAFKE